MNAWNVFVGAKHQLRQRLLCIPADENIGFGIVAFESVLFDVGDLRSAQDDSFVEVLLPEHGQDCLNRSLVPNERP
eukprot:3941370-Rhodomonas_salina.1